MIELIVTMAIAAVVLSIAVPSYQTSIQNNRKTTSINSLATSLQLARSTAISRRVTVTVCKSNDITNAVPTCRNGGGSGDWSQGWMIFTNANDNTSIDGADTLLRVQDALQGRVPGAPADGVSLIGNDNAVDLISFSAQGLARASNGTISYCDTRGATTASALNISRSGQVQNATDTNNDGIVDVERIIAGAITRVNITCP